MKNAIPTAFLPYTQQPVCWMTYYGDILNGILFAPFERDDYFYIISNNQLKAFRVWQKETPGDWDKLDTLGWKFSDYSALTPVPELDSGQMAGNPLETAARTLRWTYRKMFVFGAGASAFCIFGEGANALREFPWRPPLANELFHERFEDLLEKYPGARHIIPDLIASGNDLEAFMERQWERIRKGYSPADLANFINIQFYLRELTQQFTAETAKAFYRHSLFTRFASQLRNYLAQHAREGVSLVSFNYDTLLDQALEAADVLRLDTMQGYTPINERQAALFKPHGSWNWGWRAKQPQTSFAQHLYDQRLDLGQAYRSCLGSLDQIYHRYSWGRESAHHPNGLGRFVLSKDRLEVIAPDSSTGYFPALLIPLRDKDELLMPYAHQDYLSNYALPEVEDLYLIGWKGSEAIFNNLLKEHGHRLKRITVVNPDLERVQQNLAPYLSGKTVEWNHAPFFSDFVDKHLPHIFPDSHD